MVSSTVFCYLTIMVRSKEFETVVLKNQPECISFVSLEDSYIYTFHIMAIILIVVSVILSVK